jgi:predicted XRE-type DNA-binding protein
VTKKISVKVGSENVFADLGFPNPEEHLAKAAIAYRIMQTIRARRLTQIRAARIMGIDQPKISRLLHGHLREFSTERLLRFATRLGQDVEIVMRTPRRARAGRLRVVTA